MESKEEIDGLRTTLLNLKMSEIKDTDEVMRY